MRINKKISIHSQLFPLLLSGLFLLTACGEKENKNGQALVSVNGDEITIPQLNEELAQDNNPGGSGQDQIKQRKKALENLVDRQLLTNKAMQGGLNRDLEILLNLERVKSQILAQAYLKKHIESTPPPSEVEIAAFYNAHPDSYSHRKIYEMKELAIDSADYNAKTQEAIDGAKSLDDVISWFEIHRIKNSVSQTVRNSSDIPEPVVQKANNSDSPQIFVLSDSGKTMFITLTPIKDSPVSLQEASAGISDFLINKKNDDAAEAMLRRLRAEAKIETLNLKAVGLDGDKLTLFSDDATNSAAGEKSAAVKSDTAGIK